jgi:hypothetical protein
MAEQNFPCPIWKAGEPVRYAHNPAELKKLEAEGYTTTYANLGYVAYPKMLYKANEQPRIANDAAHEEALKAEGFGNTVILPKEAPQPKGPTAQHAEAIDRIEIMEADMADLKAQVAQILKAVVTDSKDKKKSA